VRFDEADLPKVRVLAAEEFERMREAIRDPEYFARLVADAKVQDLVEVDNPMHREVRPRRGLEK
jgi:hypothetical protein